MTYLKEINACTDAREWADAQPDYKTAWKNCERGDWMLWIAKKQGIDLKKLTKAKVECAKLVEHLMKDERSINALRVAEKFSEGKASSDELRDASFAALAAAGDAGDAGDAADAAADAADAAADAADAAADAADAAADAADAAADAAAAAADAAGNAAAAAADAAGYSAADAAADAAGYSGFTFYAAGSEVLKKCADICREHISFDDLKINSADAQE